MERIDYKIEALDIQKSHLEKLMGYEAGSTPEPLDNLIDDVLEELPQHSKPAGAFVILPEIRVDQKKGLIRSGERIFHTDKVVSRMLRKAEQAALFVTTAGAGIELWFRELTLQGDSIKSYLVDIAGSNVADRVAEKVQEKIEQQAELQALKTTHRYSPGYCNWPVSDQPALFSFFPRKPCGIELTESCLMKPVKSISGIIGIGPEVRKLAYQCETCDMDNCIYRRLKS